MIAIEHIENLNDEIYKLIDVEFNKFATKNEVICNYTPFNFIAKEDNKIIGVITGHSYYNMGLVLLKNNKVSDKL